MAGKGNDPVHFSVTPVADFHLVYLITSREGKNENYLVVSPDYKTMHQATKVTFMGIMRDLGSMNEMKEEFTLHDGRKVFFRTVCKNPWSIEGVPRCYCIWGDENGLFPRLAWVNMQARVALMRGKILLTSTPYTLNWFSRDVVKPALDGAKDIAYERWASVDNPAFPREEFERMRQKLSPKEFARKFLGEHNRMEGLIYEDFGENNIVEPFPLSEDTVYYGGIDWGFDHPTAIEIRAFPGDGKCYTVSIFKRSGLMVSQVLDLIEAKHKTFHVKHFMAGHDRPDLIQELEHRGIPVSKYFDGNEAFREVNAGNQKHNELIRETKWRVFRGIEQVEDLLDEIETYAWNKKEGEEYGKEKPRDENNDLMDAIRYCTVGTYHLLDRQTEKVEMPIDWKWKVDTFDPSKVEKPSDPMGY